ncbi:MAG: DNA repair protein RecO [Eubacteriaceae bacterium]|nr:DNA repair protein RecO [Eubacteriaceae bacterium]
MLKSTSYGDNDRILTILTREHGKITATAKGAQSVKSAHIASCAPFAKSDFRLSESSRTKRLTVSASRLLNSHYRLSSSYLKLSMASYISEAIGSATEEGTEDYWAYQLLNAALALAVKADDRHLPALAIGCMLKLFSIFGVLPHFSGCVLCGAEFDGYYFSFEAGGLACASCTDTKDLYLASDKAQYLNAASQAQLEQLAVLEPPSVHICAKLLELLNQYYTYTFNKKLRSFISLIQAENNMES